MKSIGCTNQEEKKMHCSHKLACCQHCVKNICNDECKYAHSNWCPDKAFIINGELVKEL